MKKWETTTRGGELLTGDVDHDDELEIVIQNNASDINVFDHRGRMLSRFTLPYKDQHYSCYLKLLADIDQDHRMEMGTGERRNEGELLSADYYNNQGSPELSFKSPLLEDSSYFRPVHVFDDKSFLFNIGDYSYRGPARYNENGELLWQYDVGPHVRAISIYDDRILGLSLFTSHNGKEGNGNNGEGTPTDDGNLAVVLIDKDGNELFTKKGFFNSPDGRAYVYVDDFDNDGEWEVLVLELHIANYYPGKTQLYMLNNRGEIEHTYESINNCYSPRVGFADFTNDGKKEIVVLVEEYTSKSNRSLMMLDSELNLLHEKDYGHPDAINDIDGDGDKELIVRDETRIVVLDNQLKEKYTCELHDALRRAIVSDIDLDGVNDIIVLSKDKLYGLSLE